MATPNDLLLEAYRRAGIQVVTESAPVEDSSPAARGETKVLSEAELEAVMLTRAGIVSREK